MLYRNYNTVLYSEYNQFKTSNRRLLVRGRVTLSVHCGSGFVTILTYHCQQIVSIPIRRTPHSPVLGAEQLTKRDRPYEAPNKADWSEDGPCTLVR